MRATTFISLVLFSNYAAAQVNADVLCFTSDGNRPLRFELRTYYDLTTKWSGGYVKYEKSKNSISIVVHQTREDLTASDAPSSGTTNWVEVWNGQVSGSYEMESQGVQLISMTYIRRKDGKRFSFHLDSNVPSSLEKGCSWSAAEPR